MNRLLLATLFQLFLDETPTAAHACFYYLTAVSSVTDTCNILFPSRLVTKYPLLTTLFVKNSAYLKDG